MNIPNLNSLARLWKQRPLTRRLLLSIILFSTLATFTGVTLQLYIDYRQHLDQIDNQIKNIQLTRIESLANSLWSLNSKQLETELQNIAKLPDIISLKIIENDQVLQHVGRAPYQNEKNRLVVSPLVYQAREGLHHIGDIEILVSLSGAEQRVFERLQSLIFTQGFQIFLISIFILFIFHSQIVRHLGVIAEYAKNMNIDELNHTLDLHRPKRIGNTEDELQILVNAINQMNQRLAADIEERQRSETEMLRLRNYLSNIIDSMPSVLIGVDVDCKVTQWNSEASRLTGLSRKQVLGKPLAQAFPRLESEIQLVRDAIKTRQKQTILSQPFQQNGITRYEDITIYPLVADGIEGAVIRLDDITEKNINEIALRRAQKMDAIGQLTGGIAHDFNNILGIVMGNLQLLQMKFADNEDAMVRIEKALKGTQRGADITNRLLQFSRHQMTETVQINVNQILENMDELITKSLTVSISVSTHFDKNLWLVNADPGDLEDAILNLSLNAKDAMPEGGKLSFTTANKVLDQHYVNTNPGSHSGEFVMISVQDNGTGMSDNVRDKVLEPFFTTKEQGKGTGLGLSMVYGFVKRSGGHIQIETKEGEGSTFSIFLPRARTKATQELNDTLPIIELPKGSETILVVDDEEAMLDIASEHLSVLGYSVLIATDAQQALDILATNHRVDLVFSDIVMPGEINGYQLAETVHNTYPAIKLLLASGFTKLQADQLANEDPAITQLTKNRLRKPYSHSELAIAIRRALDQTS